MKRITLIALLLITGFGQPLFARDGYHIQLKFTDMKDTLVFLAHYFGEPLPKIYKADSAHFDKNGVATFDSKQKVVGGIYLMLLSDKKTYFEFLLNNGDDMTITATAEKLPTGVKFKGSPENEKFMDYVGFLKDFGAKQQALQKQFEAAKTKEDTTAVRTASAEESKKLTEYRRTYIKSNPGSLLSNIFKSLEVPQIPEGKHFLEDGKTLDSNFNYTYYKKHFWDDFDFQDDRLIHTPIYNGKLDEYINKLTLPWPDSMEHEADMLLKKTKGTHELFKYTLWWMTHNVENSKIMGMDEVFVYLVENYYMKGDATWLSPEDLQKYTDRASKIAPNVIGNVSPEVKLKDVRTDKEVSMLNTKAKYTLLIFWSPGCGHCITEMPLIDSLYGAVLKAKGVKIYSVITEEEKKLDDFLKKHELKDWIITSDPDHSSDFRTKFDVYSTPTIYLLDEKKIIRGKRIDHTNIPTIIEFLEKKEKKEKEDKQKSK
jgi:thiol-disulfide isomerase/thioredoxin